MRKHIRCIFFLWVLLIATPFAYSQNVALSPDNSAGSYPDPSAVLDLSNCTGGFLLPCMTTTQLTAQLPNGSTLYPNSMLVFCTDDNCFWSYYNNGVGSYKWFSDYCLCSGGPAAPGAITGTASVTNGSIYTYSVTAVAGATTYNWTVPTGATVETGAGTNSVTVLMACTAGNVGVSAGNSCGTSTVTTEAITISTTTPVAPPTPTGPTPICAGSTGNVYTVTGVTGASSYTWTVPAAVGTIVGVATNNTITVTAAAGNTSGSITVKTNFACGAASASSAGLTVQVQTALTAPVVTGTTPITINSTNNTYSVPAVTASNINSYVWTPSSASLGTITAGATTDACSVTAASSASTTYSMQISESNACGTATTTYPVTVTTCSGIITRDATGSSGNGTNHFTIVTTLANDLVIVSCNGFGGTYNGTGVTVTGAGTPAATQYTKTNVEADANLALYSFVATTAGTYTVTVNEGSNYSEYSNFAVALKGFCSTPSAANIVYAASNYNGGGCSGPTSINAGLQEAAGSYAIGSFTNFWCGGSAGGNPTWSLTDFTLGYNYTDDAYGFAGQAISTASASSTITATQPDGSGFGYSVLYLIDVH